MMHMMKDSVEDELYSDSVGLDMDNPLFTMLTGAMSNVNWREIAFDIIESLED
jgi:hypothetical protein